MHPDPSDLQNTASRMRAAVAIAMLLLLTACSSLPMPTFIRANPLDALEYSHWLAGLSITERAAERIRLERDYASDRDLISGVQLALLLSSSGEASRSDIERGLEILDTGLHSLTTDPEAADRHLRSYRDFAQLWRSALSRHLTALTMVELRNEQNQLAGEQILQLREDNQRLRGEIEQLQDEVPLLREENQSLQLQLEALKAIEEQMNQREQQQELP